MRIDGNYPEMHSIIFFRDKIWGISYADEEGILYRLDEGKVYQFDRRNSKIRDDVLMSLAAEGDDKLWIGGYTDVYSFDGDSEWKRY